MKYFFALILLSATMQSCSQDIYRNLSTYRTKVESLNKEKNDPKVSYEKIRSHRKEVEDYYENNVLPHFDNMVDLICDGNTPILEEVMEIAYSDSLSAAEDLHLVLGYAFLCVPKKFSVVVNKINSQKRNTIYECSLLGLRNALYNSDKSEEEKSELEKQLQVVFNKND